MVDRVFPTLEQGTGLATPREFNGINWERVAQDLSMDTATMDGPDMPDDGGELEPTFGGGDMSTSEEPDWESILNGLNDEGDGSGLDSGLDGGMGGDLDTGIGGDLGSDMGGGIGSDMGEDFGSDMGGDLGGGLGDIGGGRQTIRMHKASNNRMPRVYFTDPKQISAEAIEVARKEGNTVLANTILKARLVRREVLAGQIEAANEHMTKLASRSTYRQELVKQADKKGETASKMKITLSSKKTTATPKSVGAMNKNEKNAFAKAAISRGFPQEYVDAFLGSKDDVRLSKSEIAIREVMASSLPMATKKSALESMMRTANLAPDQAKRLEDYWIKDMNYGDPEWVKNWINKDYTKKSED